MFTLAQVHQLVAIPFLGASELAGFAVTTRLLWRYEMGGLMGGTSVMEGTSTL